MVIRLNIGNRRSNLPISVLVAGIFGKKHPQIADLNSFFPKTGNRNLKSSGKEKRTGSGAFPKL
jgi:hypothetical protein